MPALAPLQGDVVFITRLFHPLIAFSPDEAAAGAEVPTPETTEAPTADQPEVTTPDAPEAGTGDTEAPETPDAPESDTESFTDVNTDDLPEDVATRYQQMQADYTRKTQALAERNSELDAVQSFAVDLLADEPNDTQEAVFRTLAERLGYELPDEPAPDEEGDEPAESGEDVPEWAKPLVEDHAARTAADKAQAEAEAEAAREQELDQAEQAIDTGITDLAKADGIELSKEEQALIFSDVLALPPLENGPNVQGAYDRYKAAVKAYTDRWVKSKGSAQAPAGQAGDEPVDFRDEEARLAYTARAVEAAQRAQSDL